MVLKGVGVTSEMYWNHLCDFCNHPPLSLTYPYLLREKFHQGGGSSLVLKWSKVCELQFQVLSVTDLGNVFLMSTRVSPRKDHLMFFQFSKALMC